MGFVFWKFKELIAFSLLKKKKKKKKVLLGKKIALILKK